MDAYRTVIVGGGVQAPLLQRILNRVFRCSHRHLGLPITLRGESFAVCLDCGERVAYDLKLFGGRAHPREQAPLVKAQAAAKAQDHAQAQTAAPDKPQADNCRKRRHRRRDRLRTDQQKQKL